MKTSCVPFWLFTRITSVLYAPYFTVTFKRTG